MAHRDFSRSKIIGLAGLTALLLYPTMADDKVSTPAGVGEVETAQVVTKVWDDEKNKTLHLPPANADFEPVPAPESYYNKVPEREIWKSYPVYHPDYEPEGYLEWLGKQEPELVFDASKLKTDGDWIAAGELVFDAPTGYNGLAKMEKIHNREWYEKAGIPVDKDHTVPFFRYVIREKGTVDIGEFSCATCHTRVLEDGTVIKGAQGNLPLERIDQLTMKSRIPGFADRIDQVSANVRRFTRSRFDAPWVKPDPLAALNTMSYGDIADAYGAIPAGVQARFGASIFYPVQVPDLIGVKDRRYLDRTGRSRHRDIEDLKRYMVLTTGISFLTRYGDFIPGEEIPDEPYPTSRRYSDAQLHSLALYLYSLEAPANPNPFDEKAALGKKIFEREECFRCHKPPLYSNNLLTPVDGYEPPEDHPEIRSIMPLSVGTDPSLALKTRRGTGLYKVPSLRGVWYRGPFEHSGSVATLEDWFDPRRLQDDYVPTGFVGYGVETRAVKGHKFGLDLSPEEKAALIAFLKTL